jgi:hypothetical protein
MRTVKAVEEPRRVSLFSGHYGSGKTNIAVNYALALREKGREVTIADLDIVNPYFRTKDSADALAAAGIRLVSPAYANSNVDLPALPQEMYGVVADRSRYAILDIGGDDRGAVALGRYTPTILEEGDFEHFFVVNFYRPLTQTPEDALEVLREIEFACKIPITAIINNSNLGALTTAKDVLATTERAERLAALAGVPLALTTAEESVAATLADVPMLLPLRLQRRIVDATE